MSANFEPDRQVVTAITNANPAVVTAASHGYTSGNYVRINVPENYGMRFPHDAVEITVIDTNSFSVNVDTTLLDAFVIPIGNISNITQATNAVVTATGQKMKRGDIVYISGVTGMTEVNGNNYRIISISGDDITLNVDSTGFTPYTGNGTIEEAFSYAESIPISEETENTA